MQSAASILFSKVETVNKQDQSFGTQYVAGFMRYRSLPTGPFSLYFLENLCRGVTAVTLRLYPKTKPVLFVESSRNNLVYCTVQGSGVSLVYPNLVICPDPFLSRHNSLPTSLCYGSSRRRSETGSRRGAGPVRLYHPCPPRPIVYALCAVPIILSHPLETIRAL